MRRFQSGTLGRSVRRWGRFRGAPFKRKQRGTFTTIVDESAVSRSALIKDVILFDASDWATSNIGVTAVRNVVMDMRIMIGWSPEITTQGFDSWYFHYGIFKMDDDDDPSTVNATFLGHRPLGWDAFGRNSQEVGGGLSNPDARHYNKSMRLRAASVGIEEEIRFIGAFNSDVTATLSNCVLSMAIQFSYEVP